MNSFENQMIQKIQLFYLCYIPRYSTVYFLVIIFISSSIIVCTDIGVLKAARRSIFTKMSRLRPVQINSGIIGNGLYQKEKGGRGNPLSWKP